VLHSGGEELDFVLFGIVSQENQYRAVSLLEDALKSEFRLSEYIPYNLKQGRLFRFSLYNASDRDLSLEYFFIPNTSNFEESKEAGATGGDLFSGVDVEEQIRLVKELPKTDYFLIVKGEQAQANRHALLGALSAIPSFVRVQSIEPRELQSGRNLVF
jgi:hypothetical protein